MFDDKQYSNSSYVLRKALLYFLPLSIIAACILAYIAYQEVALRELLVSKRQSVHADFVARSAELELQSIIQDLTNVSLHLELRSYLTSFNKNDKQALTAEYFSFIKNNRKYDQIRLILLNGMEDIRINKILQGAQVVPDNQLQDKSSRYYFSEAKDLPSGAVYISPLDLNIENGAIEQPIKPTIRITTPCYDKDKIQKGVIVLNYLADDLLKVFSKADYYDETQLMLLNRNGYWLYSKNTEDTWGFMYPDKKDVTFINKYPDAWKNIRSASKGQFYDNGSLVTFNSIYFIPDESNYTKVASSINWKVICIIPRATLQKFAFAVYGRFLFIFALILILICTLSFIHAKRISEKMTSQRMIEQGRRRFKQLADSSWDIVWESDPTGNLTYVSL